MSPVGSNFRQRLQMCPSIVNCCSVDYFNEWPKEALVSVATSYMQDANFETYASNSDLVDICVTMHISVAEMSNRYLKEQKRFNYVTPSSFLELLKLFGSLVQEKRSQLSHLRDSFLTGMQKLTSTRETVLTLQTQLSELKPYLEKTAEDTKRLIDEIFKDQEEVDKTKAVITMEEVEVAIQTKEIQVFYIPTIPEILISIVRK